jgi:hypothetical protein
MKLRAITFKAIPRMPGIRADALATIECEKPHEALNGWTVQIRGQQVFFVSPPGWNRETSKNRQRDPNGPVTIFEVPRGEVLFEWVGTSSELDAFFRGGKFESEPFGPKPLPPAVSAAPIPAGEQGDA